MRYQSRYKSRYDSPVGLSREFDGGATIPSGFLADAFLEVNFVRNQAYVKNTSAIVPVTALSGWSYSRTGTRFSDSADGSLTSFAANTPRITDKGLAVHSGATNLFINSSSPATQNVTTSNVEYTLSFYGTGSITLSGTSTAGPLTGTGANDRVSLTFTPTAGTLTLTVAGSIDKVQLETGSYATPYIPTAGASASAAADAAALDVGVAAFGNAVFSDNFSSYADQAAALAAGYSLPVGAATLDAANDQWDYPGSDSAIELSDTLINLTAGEFYIVTFTTSDATTGTLDVRYNGAIVATPVTSGANGTFAVAFFAVASAALRFTGYSGYDGSINSVQINPARWTNLGNLDPANGFWVYAEFEPEDRGTAATDGAPFSLRSAATADWFYPSLDRTDAGFDLFQRAGSVDATAVTNISGGAAVSYSATSKIAAQYDGSTDFRASLNGGAVSSGTAIASMTITRLLFGAFASNPKELEGYVRRIVIGEGTLTDAQLQALST